MKKIITFPHNYARQYLKRNLAIKLEGKISYNFVKILLILILAIVEQECVTEFHTMSSTSPHNYVHAQDNQDISQGECGHGGAGAGTS